MSVWKETDVCYVVPLDEICNMIGINKRNVNQIEIDDDSINGTTVKVVRVYVDQKVTSQRAK